MNTTTLSAPTSSKALHISLWVVQILLAVAFGLAGFTKLMTPIDQLSVNMPWVLHIPEGMVRFIGASEFTAALGLTLPSLTRIKPMLTVFAAGGLVLVMILAAGLHIKLGEFHALPINAVLVKHGT